MAKIIGTGAAGNKAAINLIDKGIFLRSEVMLINSTNADIPEAYKDITYIIGEGKGGCGKESHLGRNMAYSWIGKNGGEILDGFIGPQDEKIYIITSIEGGTGCGSAPVIADYYSNVHEIKSHIYAFTGIEEDPRSMHNSVEFFKSLKPEFIVETVSNKKFYEEVKGNLLKAEKLANDELAKKISVVLGRSLIDSEQNVDSTDLDKTIQTPGYMIVESATIDKSVKNKDQFNDILVEMIQNTKSLEISSPKCARIAVIMNIKESNRDIIDFSFAPIKEAFGVSYEVFKQVQDDGGEQYIQFIVSGMKLPIDEIKEVYERYLEESSKVNKEEDDFFSTVGEFEGDSKSFDNARPALSTKAVEEKKKAFMASVNVVEIDGQSVNVTLENKRDKFLKTVDTAKY